MEGAVMVSSQGKPKSASYLRVATVFTGAAACAVGFGTAANAQPLHAQPLHTRAGGTPAQYRTRGRIRPDGEATGCDAGKSTWWHGYSTYEVMGIFTQHVEVCVGYTSPTPTPGLNASGFCGGNNYGSFLGTNGVWHHFSEGKTIYYFKAKNGFPGSRYSIKSVSIFGWSQGDTCPATT
jgi:hypothetical protein